jgi:hypothetical protein
MVLLELNYRILNKITAPAMTKNLRLDKELRGLKRKKTNLKHFTQGERKVFELFKQDQEVQQKSRMNQFDKRFISKIDKRLPLDKESLVMDKFNETTPAFQINKNKKLHEINHFTNKSIDLKKRSFDNTTSKTHHFHIAKPSKQTQQLPLNHPKHLTLSRALLNHSADLPPLSHSPINFPVSTKFVHQKPNKNKKVSYLFT